MEETLANPDKWSVLYALVSFLIGGGLLKLVQFISKNKKEKTEELKEDGLAFRANLIGRIQDLEAKVKISDEQLQENMQRIIELSKENSALEVKVEALDRENKALKKRLNNK